MRELDMISIGGTDNGNSMSHGTTVTQANSNATGVVYKDHTTSFTVLVLGEMTGTFTANAADTISDDYGSCVYTPDDTSVTSLGVAYWPDSSAGEGDGTSLSLDSREDGLSKRLRGSRGTFTVAMNAGEPAFLNFEIRGVEELLSDIALLTGVTFELPVPPKFQNASFSINDGSAYAALVTSLSLAMNNELANRLSANEVEGIQSVRIPNRGPGGSYDPETVLVATHDFFNNWFDGTTYTLGTTLGSTTGNQIEIFTPRAQSDTVGDADRDGIATSPVDFSMHAGSVNSPADDELVIFHK